jgi:dTDP-4-dehydrorhamnose 3,5-epimerase
MVAGSIVPNDSATVGYLCSEGYSPSREHGIHPLDPVLALPWPASASPVLSPKDAAAPIFLQAQQSSLLSNFAACQEYVSKLRG